MASRLDKYFTNAPKKELSKRKDGRRPSRLDAYFREPLEVPEIGKKEEAVRKAADWVKEKTPAVKEKLSKTMEAVGKGETERTKRIEKAAKPARETIKEQAPVALKSATDSYANLLEKYEKVGYPYRKELGRYGLQPKGEEKAKEPEIRSMPKELEKESEKIRRRTKKLEPSVEKAYEKSPLISRATAAIPQTITGITELIGLSKGTGSGIGGFSLSELLTKLGELGASKKELAEAAIKGGATGAVLKKFGGSRAKSAATFGGMTAAEKAIESGDVVGAIKDPDTLVSAAVGAALGGKDKPLETKGAKEARGSAKARESRGEQSRAVGEVVPRTAADLRAEGYEPYIPERGIWKNKAGDPAYETTIVNGRVTPIHKVVKKGASLKKKKPAEPTTAAPEAKAVKTKAVKKEAPKTGLRPDTQEKLNAILEFNGLRNDLNKIKRSTKYKNGSKKEVEAAKGLMERANALSKKYNITEAKRKAAVEYKNAKKKRMEVELQQEVAEQIAKETPAEKAAYEKRLAAIKENMKAENKERADAMTALKAKYKAKSVALEALKTEISGSTAGRRGATYDNEVLGQGGDTYIGYSEPSTFPIKYVAANDKGKNGYGKEAQMKIIDKMLAGKILSAKEEIAAETFMDHIDKIEGEARSRDPMVDDRMAAKGKVDELEAGTLEVDDRVKTPLDTYRVIKRNEKTTTLKDGREVTLDNDQTIPVEKYLGKDEKQTAIPEIEESVASVDEAMRKAKALDEAKYARKQKPKQRGIEDMEDADVGDNLFAKGKAEGDLFAEKPKKGAKLKKEVWDEKTTLSFKGKSGNKVKVVISKGTENSPDHVEYHGKSISSTGYKSHFPVGIGARYGEHFDDADIQDYINKLEAETAADKVKSDREYARRAKKGAALKKKSKLELKTYKDWLPLGKNQHPFLLDDGTMTDPYAAHREISQKFIDSIDHPIHKFMSKDGAVRLIGSSKGLGVEIVGLPNKAQIAGIKRSAGDGSIFLDISGVDGKIKHSQTFDNFKDFNKKLTEIWDNTQGVKANKKAKSEKIEWIDPKLYEKKDGPKAGGKIHPKGEAQKYIQENDLKMQKVDSIVRVTDPMVAKDIKGVKHKLKKGEEVRAYKLSNGEFYLTDGPPFIAKGDELKKIQKKNLSLDTLSKTKVVDENGKPKMLYSGHSNVELYGEFDPKKATAGAFYATEDPAIASSYATGKFGSKEYFEKGSQYRFKGKNGKWNKKLSQIELTPEQIKKLEILKTKKDEYGEYSSPVAEMDRYIENQAPYDKEVRQMKYMGGSKNLQAIHQFFEGMGHTIAYADNGDAPLVERQQKNDFEDLLDHLGIKWQSYDWHQPGVMPIYLDIKNPIDTSKPFPSDLLAALKKKSRFERTPREGIGYGLSWTKDYPLKQWVKDIEDGNDYWPTQVPKKALPIIKSYGYDGIKDLGGKSPGADKHAVWLAFEPEQIIPAHKKGLQPALKTEMQPMAGGKQHDLFEDKPKKGAELKKKDERLYMQGGLGAVLPKAVTDALTNDIKTLTKKITGQDAPVTVDRSVLSTTGKPITKLYAKKPLDAQTKVGDDLVLDDMDQQIEQTLINKRKKGKPEEKLKILRDVRYSLMDMEERTGVPTYQAGKAVIKAFDDVNAVTAKRMEALFKDTGISPKDVVASPAIQEKIAMAITDGDLSGLSAGEKKLAENVTAEMASHENLVKKMRHQRWMQTGEMPPDLAKMPDGKAVMMMGEDILKTEGQNMYNQWIDSVDFGLRENYLPMVHKTGVAPKFRGKGLSKGFTQTREGEYKYDPERPLFKELHKYVRRSLGIEMLEPRINDLEHIMSENNLLSNQNRTLIDSWRDTLLNKSKLGWLDKTLKITQGTFWKAQIPQKLAKWVGRNLMQPTVYVMPKLFKPTDLKFWKHIGNLYSGFTKNDLFKNNRQLLEDPKFKEEFSRYVSSLDGLQRDYFFMEGGQFESVNKIAEILSEISKGYSWSDETNRLRSLLTVYRLAEDHLKTYRKEPTKKNLDRFLDGTGARYLEPLELQDVLKLVREGKDHEAAFALGKTMADNANFMYKRQKKGLGEQSPTEQAFLTIFTFAKGSGQDVIMRGVKPMVEWSKEYKGFKQGKNPRPSEHTSKRAYAGLKNLLGWYMASLLVNQAQEKAMGISKGSYGIGTLRWIPGGVSISTWSRLIEDLWNTADTRKGWDYKLANTINSLGVGFMPFYDITMKIAAAKLGVKSYSPPQEVRNWIKNMSKTKNQAAQRKWVERTALEQGQLILFGGSRQTYPEQLTDIYVDYLNAKKEKGAQSRKALKLKAEFERGLRLYPQTDKKRKIRRKFQNRNVLYPSLQSNVNEARR